MCNLYAAAGRGTPADHRIARRAGSPAVAPRPGREIKRELVPRPQPELHEPDLMCWSVVARAREALMDGENGDVESSLAVETHRTTDISPAPGWRGYVGVEAHRVAAILDGALMPPLLHDGKIGTGVPGGLPSPGAGRGAKTDRSGMIDCGAADESRLGCNEDTREMTSIDRVGLDRQRGVALREARNVLRILAWAVLIASPASAQLYRIETVAGGGDGVGDGGPAIEAKLESPQGIAVDAVGNIFIADKLNNRVRKIDSAGIIVTFAGSGQRRAVEDNVLAAKASVLEPAGLAVDRHGNVYIAESGGNRVRRVDRSGIISTIAGTGEPGFGGDRGAATAALLHRPSDVAVDLAGNVYVADNFNHRVRAIDTDGMIRTVAGTGVGGSGREGAIATQSDIFHPTQIAIDPQGNLYIAGQDRISKVDASGTIRTFGGPSPSAGGGLTLGPRAVAVDLQGIVYFTRRDFSGISKVGVSGVVSSVLDIPQDEYFPEGLAVDASGTLFFSNPRSNRLYSVQPGGEAVAVAGLGFGRYTGEGGPATDAKLQYPQSVAADRLGNLYLQDGSLIRKVDSSGTIRTVAGNESAAPSEDGQPIALRRPTGVTLDAEGNIYFSERLGHRIRQVDPAGSMSIVAGAEESGFAGDGGSAEAAQLAFPEGLAIDSAGNLYVTDSLNHRIRKIDTAGTITTLAGSGDTLADENFTGGYGGDGGMATDALLGRPTDVAVDAIGNLYIADRSNHRIRKVELSGVIYTVAGNGEAAFAGDGGPATEASLHGPIGVEIDDDGNIFVADTSNHRLRMIDASGVIRTVAGIGLPLEEPISTGDGGPAASALLITPAGVAVDIDGNVYVTDGYGNSIRKLTPVPALQPAVARIVNIASRQQGAAPEALMTIEGSDLGPGTKAVRSDPLPMAMLGTSVSVTGSDGVSRSAGLKFVAPDRINFVVPADTPTGTASVSASVPGAASESLQISVDGTAPGLFSANSSGTGVAAAEILRVAPDGTETRELAFARGPEMGSYTAVALDLGNAEDQAFLILCGTGIRRAAASTAQIAGEAISIRAVIPQPGIAGVDLVEAGPLPRSLVGRGEVTVTVTADGVQSNEVTVVFR